MDFFEFIEQYAFSREKEDKEKIWDVWTSIYPHFREETFMSFPEFYNKMIGKPNDKTISSNGKSDEQLITDAQNILKMEFVEKD